MTMTQTKPNTIERLTLDDMTHLSTGKKARLYRLLHQFGPGNGTMLFLPYDQGLEHGPVDFFENPACENPAFVAELGIRGGYSAVVFQAGVAEKTMHPVAGRVPLVLKLNGKTNVPNDDAAFSPMISTVEDAVRLGADAVGYTLYVGSPSQDRDLRQFAEVRKEAEKYGIPTIIWAYPRGAAIKAKGGQDSPYAIEYAARVACEVGADVVKINYPKPDPEILAACPKPYNTLTLDAAEAVRRAVRAAGKTMVVFSGGSKINDDGVLDYAKLALESGAHGLIFGRNMWQRPMDNALALTERVKTLMQSY
jgi:fructose-bisphosphate aldolase, class I